MFKNLNELQKKIGKFIDETPEKPKEKPKEKLEKQPEMTASLRPKNYGSVRIGRKWWWNDLKDLTIGERVVLIELCVCGDARGISWHSERKMAERLNIGRNTLRRGLKGLKQKKYIKTNKVKGRFGYYQEYQLL